MWGATAAMYFNFKTKTGVLMLMNGEAKSNPMQIMDTLYRYGVKASPSVNDTFPACNEGTSVTILPKADEQILLYPNPSRGEVTIVATTVGTLVLADMQGRIRKTISLSKGESRVELEELPPGIYLAHYYDGNGQKVGITKVILAP
jgi:hypothetical protein